jgi:hypothetical protein
MLFKEKYSFQGGNMKNHTSVDTSKKIQRNPSNPKWKTPQSIPPEKTENDQTEFGTQEGEELDENESEIDTTVPDKTEVDLDQTGISSSTEEQTGSAGPH